MPVRIYALAKELNLDSKDLVDICTKAGIPGKGSALASLEDDEVIRVKAFMEGGHKKPTSSPAAPSAEKARIGAPIRPGADHASPLGAGKKPPVIAPRKPANEPVARVEPEAPAVVAESKPAPIAAPVVPALPEPVVSKELPPTSAAPVSPAVAPPVPPPAAIPTVQARTGGTGSKTNTGSTSQGAAQAPVAPSEPRPAAGPLRREDFMNRSKGPIRVMDRGAGQGGGSGGNRPAADPKRRDDGGSKPKDAAAPRLAAMPEVRQPQQKAPQAAAQKPVMRLPVGALKGGASVASVLKDLEKPKDAGKKGKSGAPGEVPTGPAPLTGRFGSKAKKPGGKDEPDDKAAAGGGMDAIRAERQKSRGKRVGVGEEEDGRSRRRGRQIHRVKGHTTTAPRKGRVQIVLPCTVRSFSEQAGIGAGPLMKTLMGMNLMLTMNAQIPDEYVELLAAELGLDLEIKPPESLEDKMMSRFSEEEDPSLLQSRPPIVTFLGHVDHGKTSLLDRIIGTNVVSGEAGGITQHIRAYRVTSKSGRPVAFVDTPGHEAFTEMRARGANVTDIAVLVVAADDGVMRQTEEAISHAKAANVPIVVAMNKIDLPGANEQRVLEQLAANELLPSEWGGQVEVIRTSATTGRGMDDLLETLLLTAEINDYKANPNRPASGTCLEAEQEPGRGVIAKIMVRNGTLREGDVIVCGAAHGRVKAMYDTLDGRKKLKEAGPSTPVNLTGFDVAPGAGDPLYVVDDIAEAREIAMLRANETREQSLSGFTKRVSLEDFQRRLAEGRVGQADEVVTLNLIIRADVRGSIEAIQNELSKFDHPEVQIKVLQATVGGISVADVTLASASDAVIVGFNVIPDEDARQMSEERQVEIRRYDIIYKLTDDIKLMLEGKLKPEERQVELGRAVVKQVFVISRVGTVAGCYVIQGTVERNARARVFRDGRIVGDYPIDTLRREKDDTKEVNRGLECGIKLSGFNDIKQDDVLEVYKIEEFARTL